MTKKESPRSEKSGGFVLGTDTPNCRIWSLRDYSTMVTVMVAVSVVLLSSAVPVTVMV